MFTQHQPQAGLKAIEKLVHALLEAVVFKHQGVAHHDPRHARVALGKLQQHCHHVTRFLHRSVVALGNLVEQTEDAGFNELDKAFKHLRLAGEMPVQRRLRHLEARGQGCCGDALSPGLLEHGRQGLQYLNTPLTGLGSLAWRGLGIRGRTAGLRGGHRTLLESQCERIRVPKA